jgi:linoleoyl-CoA desaturase
MEQTIKFKVKNQDDRFYTAIRERVAEYLRHQTNGRYGHSVIVVKAALFLTMYWGAYYWILMGHEPAVGVVALYGSLGISGLFIAFNLSHDAAHGSLTRYPLLNKAIYYFTFNSLGMDAYLWQMRHNLSHHSFPNVDGVDADIDSNYLIRLSPNRPLLPHHHWQHLYGPILYLFYTLHWAFIKDWHYYRRENLANLRNIKHPVGEVILSISAKLCYLFYLLILPMWMGVPWQAVLGGFVVLHFVMSYFFLFTNIMNHHSEGAAFPRRDADGYLPGSWAQHQIATCVDFHPTNKVWSFFFGGFNSHCAHHLFPHVCHVHYPAIAAMIIELTAKYGLDYKQATWWDSLKSHFIHLKKLGNTPPADPILLDA